MTRARRSVRASIGMSTLLPARWRGGDAQSVTDPWLATLPTFLETPGMDIGYDKANLDRVRMLIDRQTPPPLAA